ncbi:EscU/YscU/HrcU family type III secretion system export apparatus switch protein [Aneurinibacillus sp. REN35]|uniref:EscU/YscU/HrcU family type III secretion system export apparatus switch protein n=1 Tax=Aneurinibacillus sp. REN35 TaxID=3237286 RepID=UPI003526E682
MMYKHIQRRPQKGDKPSQVAVIRYDKENDKAPTIVAQGRGAVAEKIIAKAKEHDIPMQEDGLLLENLLNLDLGSNVPPQLYQVVAEVLLLVRRASVGAPPMPVSPVENLRTLRQTPYWDGESEEEEEDISLDDLLQSIRNIE